MMKLSVGRQERFSRTLANLLLLALVLYLAVELAKLTWLIAWNDRPVPEIFGQTAAGAEVRSRVSEAPIAGYEFFGDRIIRWVWPTWCAALHRKPGCA